MALWGGFASLPSAPSFAAPEPFSASDVEEVVESHCVMCHNETLTSGGLALDAVDFTNPSAYAEPLEKMIKQLRAGTMPPGGIPRPEPAVYDSTATWLEAELDRAWAANPIPGRVTPVHRLNRFEYNNAINDLLGIDVDVMSLLPGDPTADGSFDKLSGLLPALTSSTIRALNSVTGDQELEIPVPVQAGPRMVTVSYVREHLEPEDIPQPQQRGRLLANDEVYMDYQKVYSLMAAVGMGGTRLRDTTPW